jgi:ABC-2 type transport system permease protein
MIKKALHRLRVYWTVWLTIAQFALAETFVSRWTNMLFLTGKAVRFGMLLFFLIVIKENVQTFAGYTAEQMVVFFLTYQFLDTLAQIFYRGVYEFSWKIRSGDLDFYLSKPIQPLFRILTGRPDFIDVFFFIPTTALSIYLIRDVLFTATAADLATYGILLINGFLIATAFHILILAMGIITVQVDNVVMLYRDINVMTRFPVTIYQEPLRTLLLFAIPVGIMNTIPAEVLLHKPLTTTVWVACLFGVGFFFASLKIWGEAIKQYTGAGG